MRETQEMRALRLVPLLLVVAAAASSAAPGRDAAPTPRGAVDSGGGRPKELVPGVAIRARWSPDGRRLAFVRPREVETELYVVNADEAAPRLLARSGWFAWSPDGRKIAYTEIEGAEIAISVIGVAGGRRTRLTSRGGLRVTWSPDGRKLAFVRDEALYVINADETGRRRLAPGVRVFGEPSWSPDGRLAFYPCCDTGFGVVNSDGTGLRRLVGRGVLLPAWSPDGRRIALTGDLTTRSGTRLHGTFLIRPDGTGLRRISALDTTTRAAWSPDSRELAVVDLPDVWVIAVAGGAGRRLTEGWRYGYGNSEPQWHPRGLSTAKLGGRYVSPANPTDSLVQGDVVLTRHPVDRLAADGQWVAYAAAACEAWDPRAQSLIRFARCSASDRTFGPGFARDRVAWSFMSPFMGGDNWAVLTNRLDVPAHEPVTFPSGGTSQRNLPTTAFVGDGDLLVFSTWGPCRISMSPPCASEPKTNGALYRLDGERAIRITSSPGPLTPLSVDAGKILVDHEDGRLELLTADGTSLRTFSLNAAILRGALLQGRNLVVLTTSAIEVTDAETGAFLRRWPPLAESAQLVDVQDGVAVLVSGTEIHLLRLSDGREAVIAAPGSGPVLAQLEPSGLFYSYRVVDAKYPGRVDFVPFDRLPLR